jgi:PiT family inorganic phosphate transporter
LIFIVASPVIGFVLGFIIMVCVYWIFHRWTPSQVDKTFRRGQLVSAAMYSLGHGGNDAQKTMGIITAVLATAGIFNLHMGDKGSLPAIPIYVVLIAHAAIALGTLSGGWRIVHTMGSKITKLRPVGGFSAETAGSITLFGATFLGIPVSTTHTITGAIAGVGSTTRLSAVKWQVAGRIVWAWVLTIPAAAVFAAISFLIIELIHRLVTRIT